MSKHNVSSYTALNYKEYCDILAKDNKRLDAIIRSHGYPEFWHREPGFICLVRIILEQQVSLASGKAAFDKLDAFLGGVTSEKVLAHSDDTLRDCGLTRQKSAYIRNWAEAEAAGLNIDGLADLPDEEVSQKLIAVKGIGAWTVNVYLIAALHRFDVFPVGDLALVKSMIQNGFLKEKYGKGDVETAAAKFAPYRSIFALLLWHSYLSEKNIVAP